MTEYNCETCEIDIKEGDKCHKYEDDGIAICDDCYNYYKYEIGRTG